jgi:hypothetical protein
MSISSHRGHTRERIVDRKLFPAEIPEHFDNGFWQRPNSDPPHKTTTSMWGLFLFFFAMWALNP